MLDTPVGETGTPVEPKNNVNNPVTPPVEEKKPDTAELEALRKKAEQAEMRANQLANKLEAKEKAEKEAADKELAEQNKFKDLYETRDARVKELEAEAERKEREAEVKSKTDELFKDYPDAVKELADETGLKLADVDEDTVEAFKAKLDKINAKVNNQKVTPNNPGTPTPKVDLSANDIHALAQDPKKFEEYMKKNTKGIASMIHQTQ